MLAPAVGMSADKLNEKLSGPYQYRNMYGAILGSAFVGRGGYFRLASLGSWTDALVYWRT